jgi:hypothetical protein
VLVEVRQVSFIVQESAFFDAICNPPSLVDFTLEELFLTQWIGYELYLVGEAFVELTQDATVLLNQCFELLLLVVSDITWVRDVKD